MDIKAIIQKIKRVWSGELLDKYPGESPIDAAIREHKEMLSVWDRQQRKEIIAAILYWEYPGFGTYIRTLQRKHDSGDGKPSGARGPRNLSTSSPLSRKAKC